MELASFLSPRAALVFLHTMKRVNSAKWAAVEVKNFEKIEELKLMGQKLSVMTDLWGSGLPRRAQQEQPHDRGGTRGPDLLQP